MHVSLQISGKREHFWSTGSTADLKNFSKATKKWLAQQFCLSKVCEKDWAHSPSISALKSLENQRGALPALQPGAEKPQAILSYAPYIHKQSSGIEAAVYHLVQLPVWWEREP